MQTATGASVRQKHLGEKGLILLIAFLSAFPPLSTDIYLPALPGMSKYFGVPVALTNLSLIFFFVFFSFGMLFWGPLSDKYGRKPILSAGMLVYIAASALCAAAGDIYWLIGARILQAVGCGAACAVATALVKDVYAARKRETILALVQSMVVIAPAVAPIFGALLLKFTSWRGVFWSQSGIGLLALAGALAMEETIGRRYSGTILQTMGRLGAVLRNPGFASLLVVFSMTGIPIMAFIASSSYIYQNAFDLSEQMYSYYFAVNGASLMLGPAVYMRLSRRLPRRAIIAGCFAAFIASGFCIFCFGNLKPWVFAASLLPTTIAGSCIRAPAVNLMLEQQQEDTGSASSLIGFFGIMNGSIGMLLISFGWIDVVSALGIISMGTGAVCGSLWLFLCGKSFIRRVPERRAALSE